MKSLSYKALSAATEIIFILYILGASLVMGILVFMNVEEGVTVNLSFSHLDAYDLADDYKFDEIKLESKNSDINDPVLTSLGYKLRFNSSAAWIEGGILFLTIAAIFYIGVILWFSRKVVLSLQNNSPFTFENYRRLRLIGILVLILDPLKWIVSLLIRIWVNSNFILPLGGKSLANYLGYHFGFTLGSADSFLYNSVLFGLIILVIAQVFRHGLDMKEEQDLTI